DLIRKYRTENNFIVVYAGNIGIAQNLKIVINSAEMLQNENVLFLFVGDGPYKNQLEQLVVRKEIKNVIFVGEIDREKIHEFLCLADCGVVILKRIPLFTGALPSKIFDYMACNLPILLGVEGEAKTLVEDSGTGLGFESDNSEDLAGKIKHLKNHTDELYSLASNGKDYVYNNFNRTKQASMIEDILKELLENK
ncbi:MAG: glycosyltransferase family 4 protein, partial [Candidatus Cloacimonetes bacterium]|nr:glycosyltransferase family 4 protein [Candidatus Cloacimonadota bacterium]